MALFNYATKEITLKIVYYGPGLSGKTTNIQYLHSSLNSDKKGKLLSLSTESDRTLFFDFLPIELGKIKEFSIRFQLYTVPGQVRYNATRKVVLKGADAVVFVADSQSEMRDQNIESFENMRENLISNNINPEGIPVVLQYNKRDLKNILSIDELNADINKDNAYDIVEAEAINGKGVEETFRLVTRLVLKDIARKHKFEIQPAPIKDDVRYKEIIADIPKPEPEIFQPESEVEMIEPAGYALEEELVEHGSAYEFEKKLKITDAAQKLGPKPAPRLNAEHALKNEAYEETVKEIMEVKKPAVAYPDIIKIIAGDIKKLNSRLSDIEGSVASLKTDILGIKDSLKTIKENKALAENNYIKEIRKEQKEIRSILKDIAAAFSEIKIKKSWFKF